MFSFESIVELALQAGIVYAAMSMGFGSDALQVSLITLAAGFMVGPLVGEVSKLEKKL